MAVERRGDGGTNEGAQTGGELAVVVERVERARAVLVDEEGA